MTVCLIGLGSNLGNREENLRSAWQKLAETPGVTALLCSSVYETEPLGGPPFQGKYLNSVGKIETELLPDMLLAVLMKIETELARVRTVRWGPRTIDLDLLLYGNLEMTTDKLTIPHPRMLERRFVMEPAAEIASEMPIGKTGRTIGDIWREMCEAMS